MDIRDQGLPSMHSEDENIVTPPSDRHDSAYSEPLPAKGPLITPDQRKGFAEQFSEAAKSRVQKATEGLSNLRCVISNTHELYAVQYAHLLPRAADPELVSNHRLRLRLFAYVRLPYALAARETGIFMGHEIWELAC